MEKLVELTHLFVTVFLSSFALVIVVPVITDVTMTAVCPGQAECSLAIYLIGCQQAIIGMGTVVMMPVVGNLSDKYGRKALLTLPMTLAIIPAAILAYSRETNWFYAYYAIRILTGMVSDGSINCLALAYVADVTPVGQRTSAFGILSGITSASYVCGTLAARFLSTAMTFQLAASVSMLGAVYMRVFLKDSLPACEKDMSQSLLKDEQEGNVLDADSVKKTTVFKKIPTPGDLMYMLKSSSTFSQAAVVGFFYSLSMSGMEACVLLYLKAQFGFSKDQYADLMLLISVAGMLSQLLVMPCLAVFISEEKLLAIGLFMGFVDNFLYSIAWSAWVPYAATTCIVFAIFVFPCLRSIASKLVGPHEQGKAQGCISGITSIANIIAPLIFSPMTALFLSKEAPFHFPGFSVFCIGVSTMIAFIQSLMIRPVSPSLVREDSNDSIEA